MMGADASPLQQHYRGVQRDGSIVTHVRIRRRVRLNFPRKLTLCRSPSPGDEQLGRMRQMQLGGVAPDITVRERLAAIVKAVASRISRIQPLSTPGRVLPEYYAFADAIKEHANMLLGRAALLSVADLPRIV